MKKTNSGIRLSMLKERAYYADPYCKSFTARIIKAAQDVEGNHYVVLDNTAFYPIGGGERLVSAQQLLTEMNETLVNLSRK